MTAEDDPPRPRKAEITVTQQHEQHTGFVKHEREMLNNLIGEQVLHVLGEPNGLHKVQVRPLWKGHYRVNVFIGATPAFATIVNSYFVKADENGNIVEAKPKIVKQY
jgi:hypothetical protein